MARRAKAMPALKLAPVVQLKTKATTINKEVVDCLSELFAAAVKGEIDGIVLAAMYKDDGGYTVKVSGEAWNHPTYSLGMVEMIKDKLVNEMKDRWG